MNKRYLLDTQAFVIAASDNYELSKKASSVFANMDHRIYLSVASVWEMAIKISLKKLSLPVSLEAAVDMAIKDAGIEMLPIRPEHIYRLETLPFHHRDPFDRLLLAQAQIEKMPVVSNDEVFDRYDVRRVW